MTIYFEVVSAIRIAPRERDSGHRLAKSESHKRGVPSLEMNEAWISGAKHDNVIRGEEGGRLDVISFDVKFIVDIRNARSSTQTYTMRRRYTHQPVKRLEHSAGVSLRRTATAMMIVVMMGRKFQRRPYDTSVQGSTTDKVIVHELGKEPIRYNGKDVILNESGR